MLDFARIDGRLGAALMREARSERPDCSVAAGPVDAMKVVVDAVVGGRVAGIGLGATPVHMGCVSELGLGRLHMGWDSAVLGFRTQFAQLGSSRLAMDCRLMGDVTSCW